MSVWTTWTTTLAPLVDKTPKENDVVAGWTGFAVFLGLCIATAVLLWSFSRQLRRTRQSFGVDRAGRPLDQGTADTGDASADAADAESPVRP